MNLPSCLTRKSQQLPSHSWKKIWLTLVSWPKPPCIFVQHHHCLLHCSNTSPRKHLQHSKVLFHQKKFSSLSYLGDHWSNSLISHLNWYSPCWKLHLKVHLLFILGNKFNVLLHTLTWLTKCCTTLQNQEGTDTFLTLVWLCSQTQTGFYFQFQLSRGHV